MYFAIEDNGNIPRIWFAKTNSEFVEKIKDFHELESEQIQCLENEATGFYDLLMNGLSHRVSVLSQDEVEEFFHCPLDEDWYVQFFGHYPYNKTNHFDKIDIVIEKLKTIYTENDLYIDKE